MHVLLNKLNIIAFEIAPIFYKLVFMSITAICIGAIILLIRKFADKKIPPNWKYILWGLTLVALLIPYRPQSNFALLQITSEIENVSYRQQYDEIDYKFKMAMENESLSDEGQAFVKKLENQVNITFYKSLIFDVALPLIWIFVVIIGVMFLIFSKISLSRKIRKHTIKTNEYESLLLQCKEKLGIKTQIQVVVQDYISSPALIGIFKAKILLPNYSHAINEESLSYILLHELAHFKRKDMLVNYLLLLLQSVYWFNPLLWVLFKFIREDMEILNDTYVLKRIGNENDKSYARSLVLMLGHSNKISLTPKLLCMVDNKKNVERRINMIKLSEAFKKHKILISIGCIIIAIVLGILFLTQNNTIKFGNYTLDKSKLSNETIEWLKNYNSLSELEQLSRSYIPSEILEQINLLSNDRFLTKSEIDEVNKAFEHLLPSTDPKYEYMVNPICNFFSSYYEKPEDINLEQFIRYFSDQQHSELSADNPDDIKQFEKLKEFDNFPFKSVKTLKDMPVPLQRKSLSSVNMLLNEYAGITVDKLTNTKNVLYLENPINSFYTYTSDAGISFFNCTGGKISENTVLLFSENATLTLKYKDGKYLIVSHLAIK